MYFGNGLTLRLYRIDRCTFIHSYAWEANVILYCHEGNPYLSFEQCTANKFQAQMLMFYCVLHQQIAYVLNAGCIANRTILFAKQSIISPIASRDVLKILMAIINGLHFHRSLLYTSSHSNGASIPFDWVIV